ncbi:MAG: hypothetical protein AAB436_00390 [Patescibacteria group bacterium]
MRSIARNKHVRQLICLLIADFLVFGLTDAQAVPSLMLMIGFLLLVATIYNLVGGILTLSKLYGLSIKNKRRLAASATGLIAGLIALQSIGQLNSRDIFVLLPLVILAYLYGLYLQMGKTSARA